MTSPRLTRRDPRTVARDIPGICDALFPQIAPGVVLHFNREAFSFEGCRIVPPDLITSSPLQHAMLFEIAVAAGEQLIDGNNAINIADAIEVAIRRQKRHFDAKIPQNITRTDETIIELVANNLAKILIELADGLYTEIVRSPHIPGFQWIASGSGDFAIGSRLIEVKCTNKPFSSSDYRQIMLYWLLSYASSIEGGAPEWSDAVLVNPRLNIVVKVNFNKIIQAIGAGRSKVDLLELFSSIIGDHASKMAAW
jgi:hypothetical protein